MKLEMWSKQRLSIWFRTSTNLQSSAQRGKTDFTFKEMGSLNLSTSAKPNQASTGGKWNYEFFHTFSVDVVEEIVARGCNFILLDYVEERKIKVQIKDLFWLFQHNSRIKGKRKEWSVDIVVKYVDGEFYFTSYEQTNNAKRLTQLM